MGDETVIIQRPDTREVPAVEPEPPAPRRRPVDARLVLAVGLAVVATLLFLLLLSFELAGG